MFFLRILCCQRFFSLPDFTLGNNFLYISFVLVFFFLIWILTYEREHMFLFCLWKSFILIEIKKLTIQEEIESLSNSISIDVMMKYKSRLIHFFFRAYKFIMNSGNSEILLSYAHLDEIAEVKDVFTDLKNYLLHIS